MARFKLYFVIFITLNVYTTYAQISDKRKCADLECKVPVSKAKTTVIYHSPAEGILSFKPNEEVIIYSKSAGSREDLWGAEINGRRGYVPVRFVREYKQLNAALHLVDTELTKDSVTLQVPKEDEKILPDKPNYAVIDGTTLPIDPHNIDPSSTESPVLSTSLPPDLSGSSTDKTSSLPDKFQANEQVGISASSDTSEFLSVQDDQAVNVNKSDYLNVGGDNQDIEAGSLLSSAETKKLTISGDKTTGALNVDGLGSNVNAEINHKTSKEEISSTEEADSAIEVGDKKSTEASAKTQEKNIQSEAKETTDPAVTSEEDKQDSADDDQKKVDEDSVGVFSKLSGTFSNWITSGSESESTPAKSDSPEQDQEDDEGIHIAEDNEDDDGEDDDDDDDEEDDGDEPEDEEDESEEVESKQTVDSTVKKNNTLIDEHTFKDAVSVKSDALEPEAELERKSSGIPSNSETSQNNDPISDNLVGKKQEQNESVVNSAEEKLLETGISQESFAGNEKVITSQENVENSQNKATVDPLQKLQLDNRSITESLTPATQQLKAKELHTDSKNVSDVKETETLFPDAISEKLMVDSADSNKFTTINAEEIPTEEKKGPATESIISAEDVEVGGASFNVPNTDSQNPDHKDSALKTSEGQASVQEGPSNDLNGFIANSTDADLPSELAAPHEQSTEAHTNETATVSSASVQQADASELPVTVEPVSDVPVTELPVTESSDIVVPDTKVRVTEGSVTDVPIMEVPVTEVPVTEIPVAQETVTEVRTPLVPHEIPLPSDVSYEGVTPDPLSPLGSAPPVEDDMKSSPQTDSLLEDAKKQLPTILPLLSPNLISQQAQSVEAGENKIENIETYQQDESLQKVSSNDVPLHTHSLRDVIEEGNKDVPLVDMNEYNSVEQQTQDDSAESPEQDVAEFSAESSQEQVQSSAEDSASAPGLLNSIYSYFGTGSVSIQQTDVEEGNAAADENSYRQLAEKFTATQMAEQQPSADDEIMSLDKYCDDDPISPYCRQREQSIPEEPASVPEASSKDGSTMEMTLTMFTSDVFTYLVTTAVSVIVFLIGYMLMDNSKKVGPLIAKLNKLERDYLICLKENQILQEKVEGTTIDNLINTVPNAVVDELQQELAEVQKIKAALEEQVQSLEKELENSTEVGMELNKLLSEIMSSQSGSDTLKANMEHLQRQLIEQQSTINTVNEMLNVKDTENHELHLELEISNKKVVELQSELDKLLLNLLKIEEEKDLQQNTLEAQINLYKQKFEDINLKLSGKEDTFKNEIQLVRLELSNVQRNLELKTKENAILKESFESMRHSKDSSESVKSLMNMSLVRAELEQLKSENQAYIERLRHGEENRYSLENKLQGLLDENIKLKNHFDQADKEKLEAQTKLEVLSNYFKEKEAQMQKELSKHESMWMEKQGEASSTIERIKFMQEELQNCKAQNEALKQEILSQEVSLKSQISVLEKKVSENWVMYRQAERRLEDAKQEAAQLRNRLTLRERTINDEKTQNRLLQSPLEQNGELPLSPIHMDVPSPPPLMYGGSREHLPTSPPMPPFLPPLPPPASFMPPPLAGMPPFMPPPPHGLFPGDHRPPPLGRMSSPPPPPPPSHPLDSRYSPDSRPYSPYDRNSPSPIYDSEYDNASSPVGGFRPYVGGREYKRQAPPHHHQHMPPPSAARSNGRTAARGTATSSGGSGHSNESIDRLNQHSKV